MARYVAHRRVNGPAFRSEIQANKYNIAAMTANSKNMEINHAELG